MLLAVKNQPRSAKAETRFGHGFIMARGILNVVPNVALTRPVLSDGFVAT